MGDSRTTEWGLRYLNGSRIIETAEIKMRVAANKVRHFREQNEDQPCEDTALNLQEAVAEHKRAVRAVIRCAVDNTKE